jgi:hypothetical protein
MEFVCLLFKLLIFEQGDQENIRTQEEQLKLEFRIGKLNNNKFNVF